MHPPMQPTGPGNVSALVSALATAKVGNVSSSPLNPHHQYVVDVTGVKLPSTYYGDKFFVEFSIVESDDPRLPAGTLDCSWGRPTKDKYGHGPNDIKEWIALFFESLVPGSNPGAAWNQPDPNNPAETQGAQMVRYVIDQSQPCVGSRWACRTSSKPIKTPTPGQPSEITLVHWESMAPGETRGLTPAAIATLHAPAWTPAPAAAPAWTPAPAAVPATASDGRPPNWPAALPWPPPGGAR